MKLFFTICVACGVAFSLLAVLLATRPGHEPARTPPPQETSVVHPTPMEGRKAGNNPMEVLQDERTANLVRKANRRVGEDALFQQQQVIPRLKTDLLQLQDRIGQITAYPSPEEQAKLKQLTEVYGRMEPDSIAALLARMETGRAAFILYLIGEHKAEAVLAATRATGTNGIKRATAWTHQVRLMINEQGMRP
jgi:flagellar motility protein MotE (MotC chaperone)